MTEQTKKTPEEVINILMDTPLADLVQYLISGEFIPADEPATENEVEIGEMTYLEKALYSFCLNQGKKIDSLKAENDALIENAFCGDGKLDISRLANIKNEVKILSPLLSVIIDLLWKKIRERLEEAGGKDYPSLGIRDGHKIVSCPTNSDKMKEEIEELEERILSHLFDAFRK